MDLLANNQRHQLIEGQATKTLKYGDPAAKTLTYGRASGPDTKHMSIEEPTTGTAEIKKTCPMPSASKRERRVPADQSLPFPPLW